MGRPFPVHPKGVASRLSAGVAGDSKRISRWELGAIAVLLSKQWPGVWLQIGHLFLRDGTCYRRQHGYKLKLAEASTIHLPMALRRIVRTYGNSLE